MAIILGEPGVADPDQPLLLFEGLLLLLELLFEPLEQPGKVLKPRAAELRQTLSAVEPIPPRNKAPHKRDTQGPESQTLKINVCGNCSGSEIFMWI